MGGTRPPCPALPCPALPCPFSFFRPGGSAPCISRGEFFHAHLSKNAFFFSPPASTAGMARESEGLARLGLGRAPRLKGVRVRPPAVLNVEQVTHCFASKVDVCRILKKPPFFHSPLTTRLISTSAEPKPLTPLQTKTPESATRAPRIFMCLPRTRKRSHEWGMRWSS